jgi:hypothetical protein
MKRRFVWLAVIALIGSSTSVTASAAVKAGGTCTKLNTTTISNGYKYTCVKSGKKLVWSKGVKVVEKATPAPSATPSPTPTSTATPFPSPTPTWKDPLEGTPCKVENEKVPNRIYELRCLKYSTARPGSSDNNLYWFQNMPPEGWIPSPSSTPTVSSTPNASASPAATPSLVALPAAVDGCTKVGLRIVSTDSIQECRYVKGLKMQWIKLSVTTPVVPKTESPQDVSDCQLKGKDFGSAFSGFGVDTSKRFIPPIGQNKALIVPIDFPDFVGDSNIADMLAYQKKSYLDWVLYFSKGKLNVQLDSIDRWLRAPNPAAFYNFAAEDQRGIDGNKKLAAFAQVYIDFITNEVDLSKYQTIYIMYPSKQNVIETDLVPRVTQFKIKEGTATLSVFAQSAYDHREKTPQWDFWIHETGHDWGLIGHAPGNGFPFGLMQNQSGATQSLSAWDWFVLSWMPSTQVYCDTLATLKNATVTLSPLEREDSQTKMIGVALDSHRLLVVEAHGLGKWWDRREILDYAIGSSGFYGLTAYVVETMIESPGMQTDSQGAALFDDDGNNDIYKRFTKFEKITGESSNLYNFTTASQPGRGQKVSNAYIAVLGDSFTIEGVKITFAATGDYESVKIEKVG